MPGGRPRLSGTAEEREAHKRRRVLQNVRRYRARQLTSSRASSHAGANAIEAEAVKRYATFLARFLPYQLHFGPTYRDAFVSHFLTSSAESAQIHQYVSVNLACGSFLRHAYSHVEDPSTEKRLMSEVLLASALYEYGSYQANAGIEAFALRAHNTVTRVLQQQLSEWSTSTADAASTSALRLRISDPISFSGVVIAFAVAELILHRSWDRFWVHLRGAGAILRMAGPDTIRASSRSRRHFHGYRQLALPFSLMHHDASYLSDPVWLHILSSEEHDQQSDLINELVNIAYHLVAKLRLFHDSQSSDLEDKEAQAWDGESLLQRLRTWRRSINVTDPWLPMALPSSTSAHTTNMLVAYCGLKITLYDFLTDVTAHSDARDTQNYSDRTTKWIQRGIRSLHLFLDTENSSLAKLNCLYCLEAAWVTSRKRGLFVEASECESLAKRIEDRGLPILRHHGEVHSLP